MEEAGEVLGPGELVHVQEGLVRGGLLVVLQPRAHRDRENVVPEPVHEELLRDVVNTVGVLECQIELVLCVELFKTPSSFYYFQSESDF